MSYLDNPNCSDWNDFIMDCSMTAGVDVLETIIDAVCGADAKGNSQDPNVQIRELQSASPSLAGFYAKGYIMIGDKEFSFNYESTNCRGCVVHDWEPV